MAVNDAVRLRGMYLLIKGLHVAHGSHHVELELGLFRGDIQPNSEPASVLPGD